MKTIRTSLAVAFIGLALAAFQSDALAQTRRSGTARDRGSVTSSSASRGSVKSNDKKDKPIAVTRPGNRTGDRKPSAQPVQKPAQQQKPAVRPQKPSAQPPKSPQRPPQKPPQTRPAKKPVKPMYHWSSSNHYYGHKIRVLPAHAHRHVYHGITYYCCDDIWYRYHGGHYIVCRPPLGTILAANLIAGMTRAAVNASYYNAVAQPLPNPLGLVQSYVAPGTTYYYQDGVFYSMGVNGQYSVIIPPAGALVDTLPEDCQMVILSDGNEYYRVDDTIYKVTVYEGKPYFEVVGQLYS